MVGWQIPAAFFLVEKQQNPGASRKATGARITDIST